MNKKISALLIALVCLLSVEISSAESMSIAHDQAISSIILHNGWISLISSDGDVISKERISDIRSIIFLSDHTGTTDIMDIPKYNIRIYPNPVQETLFIESANETNYKIYNIEGRCLMSGEGNAINISSLTKGTYILLINNNTFKFIKQ